MIFKNRPSFIHGLIFFKEIPQNAYKDHLVKSDCFLITNSHWDSGNQNANRLPEVNAIFIDFSGR